MLIAPDIVGFQMCSPQTQLTQLTSPEGIIRFHGAGSTSIEDLILLFHIAHAILLPKAH